MDFSYCSFRKLPGGESAITVASILFKKIAFITPKAQPSPESINPAGVICTSLWIAYAPKWNILVPKISIKRKVRGIEILGERNVIMRAAFTI